MKLFPHNQEAYESAVRMFKKEKRVCIIHPIVKMYGRVSKRDCDYSIIQWMVKQRRYLRTGKLSKEQMEKLLAIKEVNWRGNQRATAPKKSK
jgi:hypothetical protein